ncbi:MAG: iron-siderophore ABC transporter substrate-binding protein [Propionicimonas sp.]|nr:iron-siderophore ABC transporter substrate-binding protein [Propionicimonas sp.]
MRRTVVSLTLAAGLALSLAACGAPAAAPTSPAASAPGTSDPATTDSFPVTVKHAYGETVIESKPERVATVAWSNHDTALALGVVPVGMAAQTYGVTDGSGVLEWTAAKLKELGAETPVLFDETDGINFDAVNTVEPDVILAGLSGLTQEEYDTLSAIAPTIAFPGLSWGTSWRDTIKVNSAGLGMAAQGDALIADLEGQIQTAVAAYPQIAGKTAAFLYINPTDFGTIGVYTTNDARVAYLYDLGMTAPASVASLSEGSTSFYEDISAENADTLADIDIIFTYGTPELLTKLQADPLIGSIPAIKRGSVALVEDGTPLAAAVSPPSALSLTWGLEEYLALAAAAADKVA